jgi:tRNA(Met) C34 N-acetyltransferase TmcA
MVAITLVAVVQWRYELLRNEDIAEFEIVRGGGFIILLVSDIDDW